MSQARIGAMTPKALLKAVTPRRLDSVSIASPIVAGSFFCCTELHRTRSSDDCSPAPFAPEFFSTRSLEDRTPASLRARSVSECTPGASPFASVFLSTRSLEDHTPAQEFPSFMLPSTPASAAARLAPFAATPEHDELAPCAESAGSRRPAFPVLLGRTQSRLGLQQESQETGASSKAASKSGGQISQPAALSDLNLQSAVSARANFLQRLAQRRERPLVRARQLRNCE